MKKQSIVNSVLLNMIVLVFLTAASTGYAWIAGEYNKFKKESKQTKDEFTEREKAILQNEVNKVIDYIKVRKSQTEQRLKTNVKSRTHEAYEIAMNIYNENKKNGTSDEKIQKMIIDALRPIRFNNGRGYFFIVDLKGVERLYPIFPEYEGTNLLDLQDQKGNYTVQDEITLIKEKKEGYIVGYWRKPFSESEEIYKKISFIREFEPFDWYIGTGEYVDDVEKSIQSEASEYISSIRFGYNRSQYIFVTSYQGVETVNGMFPELVGENLWDMEDATGRKIVQDGIKMARENESGGYITQYWYNLNTEGTSEKLSFMKKVDDWKWVIGAGVYLDEINLKIKNREEELKDQIKRRIMYIVIEIMILIIFSLIIAKIFGMKLNYNFNLFAEFFRNSSNNYEEMNLSKINYKEFEELAQSANSMINERRVIDEEIREINDKLKKTVDDRESRLENISKNIDKMISIKTKKLVEISRRDSLTKLFNRRYILEKLSYEIRKAKQNEKVLSIMMIDVDHFKKVNDTYGHTIGDEALEKIGESISSNLRETDFAGRYGGEEFIVVMPGSNLENTYLAAEKLRKLIKEITFSNIKLDITISIGIAKLRNETLMELIEKADGLLYQAKRNGRDRIEV